MWQKVVEALFFFIHKDEEQQLTGDDIVQLVNHAGDNDVEDDNEGPAKADRICNSERLNLKGPYIEVFWM